MKKLVNKVMNIATKKEKGFSILITTVCLILIVMILIFIFRTTIGSQIQDSIQQVSNEINEISDWNTTLQNGGGETP